MQKHGAEKRNLQSGTATPQELLKLVSTLFRVLAALKWRILLKRICQPSILSLLFVMRDNMGYNSIGYHTRLHSNNSVKVVGGSFGGSIDADTVARIVKSHFTVVVKNSGTCVFVDKQGREVSLYLSVDARETEAGKAALKSYNEANRKAWKDAEAKERARNGEIDGLLSNLSYDEIVRRLSK